MLEKNKPLKLIETRKEFLEDLAKEILQEIKKELNRKHPQKEIFAHAKIYTFVRETVDGIVGDVKSAVQGLLGEIRKQKKNLSDFGERPLTEKELNAFISILKKKFTEEENRMMQLLILTYLSMGARKMAKVCEQEIKKWFPIEEEEEWK